MSSESIAAFVSQSFSDFVVETSTEKLGVPGGPTCLADFICAWLWSGKGVWACQGDFQTYTIAVIAIIDRWIVDHGMTDYVPESENSPIIKRRVKTVFGDAQYKHRALDPYFFAKAVFAVQQGQ